MILFLERVGFLAAQECAFLPPEPKTKASLPSRSCAVSVDSFSLPLRTAYTLAFAIRHLRPRVEKHLLGWGLRVEG